jgi:hypothetical protein
MATIKINNVTALTESGGTVTLDSGVTGIPAAGITGTLGSGVTFPAGMSINHVENVYSTRNVLATVNAGVFEPIWSFSYNKTVASSNLVVSAIISLWDDYSGACNIGFKYASTEVWCGWFQYTGDAYQHYCGLHGVLTGHTTTGSQTLYIGYGVGGSSNGHKPGIIVNPDSTNDEGRLEEAKCTATVYEKLN